MSPANVSVNVSGGTGISVFSFSVSTTGGVSGCGVCTGVPAQAVSMKTKIIKMDRLDILFMLIDYNIDIWNSSR